jgi:hypothetical protein
MSIFDPEQDASRVNAHLLCRPGCHEQDHVVVDGDLAHSLRSPNHLSIATVCW